MPGEPPNWIVLKECAEELTRQGLTPFTRQQLIQAVQARYPGRGESSLNPMIQGMTVNLKGGAPGGVGKEVFRRVDRGLFELLKQPELPVRSARMPDAHPALIERPAMAVRSAFPPSQKPLILVSCVKSKRATASEAQDLYTSAWFSKAKRYARTFTDTWFILSAKYGLVDPKAQLEPYELTLNDMGVHDRRIWADRVMRQLQPHLQFGQRVILLAGGRYREFLVPGLQECGCHVETPLANVRGLGTQQTWLEQAVRHA